MSNELPFQIHIVPCITYVSVFNNHFQVRISDNLVPSNLDKTYSTYGDSLPQSFESSNVFNKTNIETDLKQVCIGSSWTPFLF